MELTKNLRISENFFSIFFRKNNFLAKDKILFLHNIIEKNIFFLSHKNIIFKNIIYFIFTYNNTLFLSNILLLNVLNKLIYFFKSIQLKCYLIKLLPFYIKFQIKGIGWRFHDYLLSQPKTKKLIFIEFKLGHSFITKHVLPPIFLFINEGYYSFTLISNNLKKFLDIKSSFVNLKKLNAFKDIGVRFFFKKIKIKKVIHDANRSKKTLEKIKEKKEKKGKKK